MDELTRSPESDPTELLRYRDGIYAADLLGAAITRLDFFSWLAKSRAGIAEICASLGLAQRPVDVMLTLFSAMGLIEKKAALFQLTEMAQELLVRDSPWFLGPYYASFASRPACRELLEVLRCDEPAAWAGNKERKLWVEAMDEDAFAIQFTGTMDSRGMLLGPALARQLDVKKFRHLLDVAGGSGIYSCCILAANPHLRATVFEKAPVDRLTSKCIASRGYSERISAAVGEMFADPLPAGCDVHLWSNVLHDWDVPEVRVLLAKSFAALPSDGMIVIHDAHINREKTGPLSVAAYSVFLMAQTRGKCYSVEEMEGSLNAAGFVDMSYRKTAGDHSVITALKPG